MEMEFLAEFIEGTSHDRACQIIKRKRTKRQRPHSPFHASIKSVNNTNDINGLIDNSTLDQSLEISTQEDEDMANCLIMLAQSEEKTDQIHQKTEKLTSTSRGHEKSSYYDYECKTCNRWFPSYQALGGHKAGHKKAKANNIQESLTEYYEEDVIISDNNNNNCKGKVHECSICGSEFSSGQALGGHMRKHRIIPPSVNRIVSVTEKSVGGSSGSGSSNSSTLLLDLNFPPPEVINNVVESKFRFTSQQHLVFSSPALVDCHY